MTVVDFCAGEVSFFLGSDRPSTKNMLALNRQKPFNSPMPAKDVDRNTVKIALQKDGWFITHDPLVLELSSGRLEIDLGAEQLIAAEKDKTQIAVEIKSFLSPSTTSEFHLALGQFLNYRVALKVGIAKSSSFFSSPSESVS